MGTPESPYAHESITVNSVCSILHKRLHSVLLESCVFINVLQIFCHV